MKAQTPTLLRVLDPGNVARIRRNPVDRQTLLDAGAIVDEVREGGEQSLRNLAERFGDRQPGMPSRA